MVWLGETAYLQLSIKRMDTLKPYFQMFVKFKSWIYVIWPFSPWLILKIHRKWGFEGPIICYFIQAHQESLAL